MGTCRYFKQDMYAKILMMNLCAGLAFPIEEKVVKDYREAKKNREVSIDAKSIAPSPTGPPG